ncbi:MAG: InlB B-repeat-containing protein [Oscillospiraceae bacterium]|nr:InlB B-repeat-containing protein [Oscillospiraceae bacterium]
MRKGKNRVLPVCLGMLLAGTLLNGCGQSEHTVQFDENYSGGSVSSQTVMAVDASNAPVREGYLFLGWYKDAGLTQPWDDTKDKVKSDMTLYAGWDKDTGDSITEPGNDKGFTDLTSPESQEASYDYQAFFRPAMDGSEQPYVGDTMPFYENGVYYIYYLKEKGDSRNHSIFLTTTTDFVNYTEYDDVVLESTPGAQDDWIGTGSVVNVEGTYYLFYTGHTDGPMEYKEKVMVAVGDSPLAFTKLADWELIPPDELGQKRDFRDPQAYYDPETGNITLTITAAKDGVARILKYTLSADLQNAVYDGIIFTDPTGDFWNLECTDTFRIGDTWYITYSGQDDTLWFASSDTPYGPYGEAKRVDGKLFYAAKHVEDGENAYMVGWARRSDSMSSTVGITDWAGNLAVQKIAQKENGELVLAPVEAIADGFTVRRALAVEEPHLFVESEEGYTYADAFTCYESFLLSGEFRYTKEGAFGLSFDFYEDPELNKFITIDPAENMLQLWLNEGDTLVTETAVDLQAGETYSFTYIQEGSVGIFYIDGMASLTVRLYGASGKPIQLFAENNGVLFTSLRQYTRP